MPGDSQCMSTSLDWLNGRFIVFDGPDGSGKTTQFDRFVEYCRSNNHDVTLVREPGGTQIGEQVREILLDPRNTCMSITCEMMLYMSSRAQLIDQVIGPTLSAGGTVLADRFISSTLAYQGTGGGIDRKAILDIGDIVLRNFHPDLTVIFDVDEETSRSRRSSQPDRIEQRDQVFHERVRQGYLEQVAEDPDRYLLIDASMSQDEVFASLEDGIRNRMAAMPARS
ncbi:MAG: dTMP kinase [Phycisphaerae bacterium]|nr:dTMP kinase [Phycisphaerae bacterium]